MKTASTVDALLELLKGLPPSTVRAIVREVEQRASALPSGTRKALPAQTSAPEHLVCTLHVGAFEFLGNRPVERGGLADQAAAPSVGNAETGRLTSRVEMNHEPVRAPAELERRAEPNHVRATPAPMNASAPPVSQPCESDSSFSSSEVRAIRPTLPWPASVAAVLLTLLIPLQLLRWTEGSDEVRPPRPPRLVRTRVQVQPLPSVEVPAKPRAKRAPVTKPKAPTVVTRNPLEDRE